MLDDSFQRHLGFVRECSPYYRKRVSARAHLGDFPLMRRKVLTSNYGELLTPTPGCGADRFPAPRLLAGEGINEAHRAAGEFTLPGGLVMEQTSGTSGVPARFVKTREERQAISLAIWRRRRAIDGAVSPSNFVPLFHLPAGAVLPVNPYDVYPQGVKAFYEWLGQRESRWLHMPPALLERHLLSLRHIGWLRPVPQLRHIETSGAPVSQRTIQLAEEVLGARIVNQYGTREVWAIGYGGNDALFFPIDESVLVELVDEEGKVITEPEREGAVAVTSKLLRLLPIIRYLTGDRGCWRQTPEGRAVALATDREVNRFSIGGKRLSGGEFFKTVLGNVYSNLGFAHIDYIQIRKTGPRLFTVDISGPDHQSVFDGLSYLFRRFDPECNFVRNHIEDASLRDNTGRVSGDPNRKPYLFVNQCAED